MVKKIANKEYIKVLTEIKKQIRTSQIKAALAANKELLKLYWFIGKTIHEQQQENGWGSSTVEELAKDLQNSFPGLAGFSRANIFNMRSFYTTYEKVQQAVGQFEELPIFNVPWGHNLLLIQRLNNNKERLWYAENTIKNGWSRNMLENWIESDLYSRKGNSLTNFKTTLPSIDSDVAQQTLKDPYIFDFLTLSDNALEKDLEQGLIDHIQKFLLELGEGFAFVSRQYHLEVGDDDFYIDLLFYHIKLRCYIVVELKAGKFEPKDAGQLNFYLSAIDKTLKHKDDNPSIGLLLCKTKNKIAAEYALQDIKKPMGISTYKTKLLESLPKNLKGSLPSIQEIEKEMEKAEILTKKRRMKIRKTKKV